MKDLKSLCWCRSGKNFGDCCYKTSTATNLTHYKFDQAEKDLRMKLVDFSIRPEIQAQIGEAFYIWMNNPELFGEDMDEDTIDDLTFSKFFDWFIYDFKFLDGGKSLIEQFYEEESKNLTDVEKSILDDWMDNLYSFFEVEEVVPKEGCRIRDIFTGEVLQVKDSATSLQITLSDIIAGRPLKVGNNTYFSSVVSIYPQALKSFIIDFFNLEFKEYRKTFGKKSTPREYLKDWGFLIGHYIENILKHPQFVTPEGDEFVFASSTYSVKNYMKALERLRKIKLLEEIEIGTDELRVFSWVRKRKRNKNRILGSIEVEEGKLTIECYSLNLLAKAKKLIEDNLRDLIAHKEDSMKQLGSFLDKQPSEAVGNRKLPSGVKSQGELDTVLDEYYDRWVDTPIEALQGKTPRGALETKGGREQVDSILRELESFYEQARRRGEPYYDVGKLRKKLRLK